jgi:hypothetical protein
MGLDRRVPGQRRSLGHREQTHVRVRVEGGPGRRPSPSPPNWSAPSWLRRVTRTAPPGSSTCARRPTRSRE